MWSLTDDYAKDGGLGEVWILCSFYREPLRTWTETNVNKFAISSHTALKLGKQALKSYLKITCEIQLRSPPNKKLVPQRIMVKTRWSSDRPWSAIVSVIVYCRIISPYSKTPLLRTRTFQSVWCLILFKGYLYDFRWTISTERGDQPTSHFSMILCGHNFVVSWYFEPKIIG